MSIFNVKDLTVGYGFSSNGSVMSERALTYDEMNTTSSSDSFQITAHGTPNVVILTGGGNDTVDVSGVKGMSFIDAGTGTNTINVAGSSVASISLETSPTNTWTQDIISGFHAGDSLSFADVTNIAEFIRGGNTVLDAWNAAVPGSAIYATLVNAPGLTMAQNGNSITLHA